MSSANLPYQVLGKKLWDPDSDIRYMSLNDLAQQLTATQNSILTTDPTTSKVLSEGLLHTLVDTNGEVQNLTIKALGPFVLKCQPDILFSFVLKITEISQQDLEPTISATAVKAIVSSFPRPNGSRTRSLALQTACTTISEIIIPRLIGRQLFPTRIQAAKEIHEGLLDLDVEKGRDSNYIDVLSEVARCFGPALRPQEVEALQATVLGLLWNDKTPSPIKKKATAVIAVLAEHFSEALLSNVVSHMIETLRDPHLLPHTRKLYITAFGSMAKTIPSNFGPHLRTITPFIIAPLSQSELDDQMGEADDDKEQDNAVEEVREAALMTLEVFLAHCHENMHPYYKESLESVLRYLRYDPNYAGFGEDDDEEQDVDDEEGFDGDEDFEEEGGADDDDDLSWKLRRCASKALYAMIAARGNELLDDSTTYSAVADALVDRLREREEGVRLEILSTLTFLVRKTADAEGLSLSGPAASQSALPSENLKRKRARRRSDVSMIDTSKHQRLTGSESPESHRLAPSGPSHSLSLAGPGIVKGALKLLQTSTLATKQSTLKLLQEYIVAQQGGLSDILQELLTLISGILQASNKDIAGASAVAGAVSSATLQIEAFRLLSTLSKTHSSSGIVSKLPALVPEISYATNNRSSRTAVEAFKVLEQLVKLVTPPRTAAKDPQSKATLEEVLSGASRVVQSKSTDSAVRNEAIRSIATCLGRTASVSGDNLITAKDRVSAYDLLLASTRNEITRYASIKAIDTLGRIAPSQHAYDEHWFSETCIELGNQLRKADRALRGASLQTLRTLISEKACASSLSKDSSAQLASLLTPLLTSQDLHLIGSTILILAALIQNEKSLMSKDLTQHICDLIASPFAASVVDQLSVLVDVIGSQGSGSSLMRVILTEVSLKGTSSVVGKLIGDLLVAGGSSVGVDINAFLNEASTAPDEKRKCLALSVLGEVGLRSGSKSSTALQPDLFSAHFSSSSSEVSLAAAIALGRVAAGEGNAKNCVPVILSLAETQKNRYLLLHATKELLQRAKNPDELDHFLPSLWDLSVDASRLEDNRAVGAECLANLAILQTQPYLQKLHALLSDADTDARSATILAFRDVFASTDGSFDKDLRPIITEVLTSMLRDADVENRRAALNTFNAAIKNKFDLVMPYINRLMPLIIDQTRIDPSLVREVKMGPFTHKVDDGLECRKSAYETVYSLVEVASDRLDLSQIYDRVVAGIGDDQRIRALCQIMIEKFSESLPGATVERLDTIAQHSKEILGQNLKETAVRHEIERLDEAKRSCIRLGYILQRRFGQEAARKAVWISMLEEIKASHKVMAESIEKELKERET